VDQNGFRTWIESNISGGPTEHAAEKIGASLTADNTPSLVGLADIDDDLNNLSVAIVDGDSRRTWLEADLAGKPSPRAADLIAQALGDEGYTVVPEQYKASYKSEVYKIVSGPDVVCWGDSMTAGAGGGGVTYPGVLQSLLSTHGHAGTVRNMGVGGETSVTIAARSGAYPFSVNIVGGVIPESDDVAVNFRPINGSVPAPINVTGMTGYLGGVLGSFLYDADSGVHSFRRSVAGSAVAANRPLSFYRNDSKLRRGDIAIIWIGQNGPAWPRALQDAKAMIQNLTALEKRFIVISKPTGTTSTNAEDVTWFSEFGPRFIPARQYLVEFGLQDAGIAPTEQDLIDIAAGTVPTSLRSDSVHWNAAGYTILGNLVFNRLNELGWI
jgi:lysophospholipase L1-like esterase